MSAFAQGPPPRRSLTVRLVGGAMLILLLVAMVLSTEYVSASGPLPGEEDEFDPAAYGRDSYTSQVKPAVEADPVDLATLAPLLVEDAEAAGAEYGTQQGTSPFTYAVELTGTAGRPEGGLLPVTVPGLPRSTTISVQVGPAINGTALRDVSGEISFNDFVNQVEYAEAARALNDEMKADLLEGVDPKSLTGSQITVVGATAPLNPEVITVTPVSIEEVS